jgi:hypothetical protein
MVDSKEIEGNICLDVVCQAYKLLKDFFEVLMFMEPDCF